MDPTGDDNSFGPDRPDPRDAQKFFAVGGVYSDRKKLRVDRLELVLRAGATDPADAAMVYGCANAALGALWCPLNEAFQIKDGRARVELDFDSQMTTVSAMGAMSLKIGQALWLGLYFGLKGLKKVIAVKGRRGTKDKERKAV